MTTIDPFRGEEVLKLQLEVKWADHFMVWLGNAVQDGLNAVAVLEGEEDLSAEDT